MLTILLHSSKTMHSARPTAHSYQRPYFLKEAEELMTYLGTLDTSQLGTIMKLSPTVAARTQGLIGAWSTRPEYQTPAIDAFAGDIYSGLQTQHFTAPDRAYANDHLYILSGLYGLLKAGDSIMPYRLEMGYRLPNEAYPTLYTFWGNKLAERIGKTDVIVDLTAQEYSKAILPYLKKPRVIVPKFLSRHPETDEPRFVVVHAKIARGAFAHWLITHRVETADELRNFDELGYRYDPALSTDEQPVFVCETFGGLGLSVRS